MRRTVNYFGLLLLALAACKEHKSKVEKPYTQQDSVIIADYQRYSKVEFNRLVDSFPNLYQYPPLHPDSAFAKKNYVEYSDAEGREKWIDFEVKAYNI